MAALAAVPCMTSDGVQDLDAAAFAADDACAEAGRNQSQCALNALQRRIATIGTDFEEATAADGRPTVRLELYRAMSHQDLKYPFANVDVATPAGVMNYLHAEVVGEHVGDYAGYEPKIGTKERFNGVDAVVGVTAHVRNPDSAVKAVGNFVDFALSAHFITGQATGPAYNWNFGDIVGAVKGDDARWPMVDPWYRFSLSGFCPNLKWDEKLRGAAKAEKVFGDIENSEPEHHATTGGRRRRRTVGLCMTYSNQFGQPYGQVLRGGLCPNGTEPGKMPDGTSGCTYTYELPKAEAVVRLDELVGITKQACGSRKCHDWSDFRRHCSSRQYKRKFNYKSRRRYNTILRSKTCVEYDIHKACAKDCSSKACQQVPAHRREVGLPFWRGRCSSHMNAVRTEKLAAAFGISAQKTHQMMKSPGGETCLSSASKLCHPNATEGGMYCTRIWGGVCQPCYVPGTVEKSDYTEQNPTPMCPWSIFKATQDYANMQPECASDKPSDLCCLYTQTCNSTLLTTEPTEDGFAYVSSLQDTDKMVDVLSKAADQAFTMQGEDPDHLARLAYWQWGLGPIPGKTLESVVKFIKDYAGK